MLVHVGDNDFETEVLNSDLPCLVDFWAPWCAPCLMVAPALEEIANEYDGKIKVCKVNVDDAGGVATRYGIMSIPTLMVFKNGEPVNTTIGAMPKRNLEAFIKPYVQA